MKKILHIIPNLGIGGTEKILLEICQNLHVKVFEMKVISLKSGGQTAESLKNSGVAVTLLNAPHTFWQGLVDLPRIFLNLRKAILDFSPDLIHTWLTRANVMGRLAAGSVGFRNILSSLRVVEREKQYHLWAERWTARSSRAVTVNSTALKKFAIEEVGIPEEKVILIFNGIDINSIPSSSRHLSVGYPDKEGKSEIWIGTLGRLHKQKGMDIFLQAAKIVLEKFSQGNPLAVGYHIPQCRFLIGGEGAERKALEKLCSKIQIQSRVSFVGEVEDPVGFIQSLDIFVLSSRWEGMPNVVLEAMASCVPVVASSGAGVADLIEDGESGVLVEPENAESCAEGILRLIKDSVLRKKIAGRAYEKVKKEFRLDAMVSSYKKLYESLL